MTSSSPPHPLTPSPRHVLFWAAFLGCSWTWCIGMYLPVLLVRDYGVWGWIVFAVPNVLGAAAMGWVLRSPEQSARIVVAHGRACRSFSLVTISFQIYFAKWFLGANSRIASGLTLALALALLILAALRTMSNQRVRNVLKLEGAIVYVVSLICLAVGLLWRVLPALPPPVTPRIDAIAPLAAVCVWGFALCPYLDLTFHRARQAAETQAASRLAFGVGFGVFFFSMILFTLAYTGVALHPLRGLVAGVILIHMTVQLSYTIALHVIEAMGGTLEEGDSLSRRFPGWDVLLAAFVGITLGFAPMHFREPYHGVASGELVYRGFMAFYGLLFPAYVWLCMIPCPWARPAARSVFVFLAAVVLAAPFYWLGFIEGKMLWLLPGLLIVIGVRLAVPRGRLES